MLDDGSSIVILISLIESMDNLTPQKASLLRVYDMFMFLQIPSITR